MSDSRPDFIGMFRGDPGLSMAAKGPLRSGERMNESSVNAESPAELLARAADELAARAATTGDNVWGVGLSNPCFDLVDAVWNESGDLVAGPVAEADAHWISTMSPAVAAPLVALLRSAVLAYEDYPGLPENLMRSSDVAPAYGHIYQLVQDALDFAKQILGETDG